MARLITILLLAVVAALGALSVIAQDGPEPTLPVPNCHHNNPNWHTIRTISVTAEKTVCVYGARAAMPCQLVNPKGRPLLRAVIKPDGRVKCVYGVAG